MVSIVSREAAATTDGGHTQTTSTTCSSMTSTITAIITATTTTTTATTTTTTMPALPLNTNRATPAEMELVKRTMKLDLKSSTRKSVDEAKDTTLSPSPSVRSGSHISGSASNRVLSHQNSLTAQVEAAVEDRKALRDALYQGIFTRHRRTIFAVGSFLRMFKSRNSQYNTIRSTSEADDDGR